MSMEQWWNNTDRSNGIMSVSCHYMKCPVIKPRPWLPSLSVRTTTDCIPLSLLWLGCRLDDPGFNFRQGQIFLSSLERPDQLTTAWWHAKGHLNLFTFSRGRSHVTIHEEYKDHSFVRGQLHITLRKLLSSAM